MRRAWLFVLPSLLGCQGTANAPAPPPSASAPTLTVTAPETKRRLSSHHEGGSLLRSEQEDVLYLADEDHGVVRRITIPIDAQKPATDIKMPGAPAQVLPLDGKVLVTVRDPGMLVVLTTEKGTLTEAGRISLPSDAWGIAVTPDEHTALVSSAWSHRVTAIDLVTGKQKWSVDVAREPRAIVVRPDGDSAYVTHLVGSAVTRLDGLSKEPRVTRISLRPAPDSAPLQGKKESFDLDASLAYSAALSADGARLFVPRHAIGASGSNAWFGRPVVDVLLTGDDSTLVPDRLVPGMAYEGHAYEIADGDAMESEIGPIPVQLTRPFVQPRAIVVRVSKQSLLVAGEGSDTVAELDMRALDPALGVLERYSLRGEVAEGEFGKSRCGAPSGIALSSDETYAWVYCRSTGDIAALKLSALDKPRVVRDHHAPEDILPTLHVADDSLPEKPALGRRLFYDAADPVMSGGMACAGCHPEGRDDGHVWTEQPVEGDTEGKKTGSLTGAPIRSGSIWNQEHGKKLHKGYPRQTPMLAGRVGARGPYGWHGHEVSLDQRITVGFTIHGPTGWGNRAVDQVARAEALSAFLRQGLVLPPKEHRDLTAKEERGRELFSSAETKCASCHFPGTEFTDRSVVSLGISPLMPWFEDEPKNRLFKTPSLLFVAGTAPYFHDGHARTLEELVEENHDRMGKTSQLSPEDRAALVAYLGTIGLVEPGKASVDPPTVSLPAPATEKAAAKVEAGSIAAIEPPPAEKSLAPTWPDWKNAAEVPLARPSKDCKLFRVREWFRIHCGIDRDTLTQVSMIVGQREGVELSQGRYGEGGDIVFPVRRGDRRVMEMDMLVDAYKMSVLWDGRVYISESWLEGEASPTITVD